MSKIGFMQGRLSPLVDGRIQAFPWGHWESEFRIGAQIGFESIEWAIDADRLHDNPLMTSHGRARINILTQQYGLAVASLTGNCFMQAPLWKASGRERLRGETDLIAVAEACPHVGASLMVIPLVDNGHLEDRHQEDALVATLERHTKIFSDLGLRVALESDYPPNDLHRLLGRLDETVFGVNYDIGNSASLGRSPEEEFAYYGARIINVHVKDRLLGGGNVPLGEGSADFDNAFAGLDAIGYQGNHILETARSSIGDHAGALTRYREMTMAWISQHRT